MKRLFASLLILTLVLAGCGKDTQPRTTSPRVTAPTEDPLATEATHVHAQTLCPWEYDVAQQATSDGNLHYYFMAGDGLEEKDTGSFWGDSCLAVLPDGTTMLMDGGSQVYGPVLLQNLQRMGVKKIDHLVITGSFPEHQNGILAQENLESFFSAVQVGKVYWNGVKDPQKEASFLVETVCAQRGLPLKVLQQGDRLTLGEVTVDVLWPRAGTDQVSGTAALKNSSLVLKLTLDGNSGLFVGDLYEAAVIEMVDSNRSLLESVELLKLAGHGDGSANAANLLDALSARYAVAMGYQKADKTLKERMEKYGITMLCDYTDGYIHISTDGTETFVETSRGSTVD